MYKSARKPRVRNSRAQSRKCPNVRGPGSTFPRCWVKQDVELPKSCSQASCMEVLKLVF